MNTQEMNEHCESLAQQLANLHDDRMFEVEWDAGPYGVEVVVRVLDESQELVLNELTVCRCIKTKQAAADIASGWVEGLAVGLDGGAC